MDTLQNKYCPACGYHLDFEPWTKDSPSDEICPCCGIQFGYDDAAGNDMEERKLIYERWRNRWIKEGMLWYSQGISQPQNWNGIEQLRNLKKNQNL